MFKKIKYFKIMKIWLCISFFFFVEMANTTGICKKWFENQGLKKDKDCLIQCNIAETDMGTFQCPAQCPSLCKTPNIQKLVFNVSRYYGLTLAELALVKKHSKKMLLAYKLSKSAEQLCFNLFQKNSMNDESDGVAPIFGYPG